MQKPRQVAETLRIFPKMARFARNSGANACGAAEIPIYAVALDCKPNEFQGKSDTLAQFEAKFASK